MSFRNSPRRVTALALFAMAFTMGGAAAAHAADKPGVDAGRHPTSSACETARQQAWFQRQLRMTEGDTEPLEPMAPAECGAMAQDGPGAPTQAANSVTGSPGTHAR
jgi:hypothetical protein